MLEWHFPAPLSLSPSNRVFKVLEYPVSKVCLQMQTKLVTAIPKRFDPIANGSSANPELESDEEKFPNAEEVEVDEDSVDPQVESGEAEEEVPNAEEEVPKVVDEGFSKDGLSGQQEEEVPKVVDEGHKYPSIILCRGLLREATMASPLDWANAPDITKDLIATSAITRFRMPLLSRVTFAPVRSHLLKILMQIQ
ncbi:uncharacterized protein LOC132311892 isoform X2 [Cornus florida]|uniref:uncharacterized protein LOC132311892 isoform X2 n=1 Tax=Cornus florida TaxID=4283 RepID=UPI00289C3FEE|nr:uncharacterized protein LOC132311892 isoform X2 [Cornus florida]